MSYVWAILSGTRMKPAAMEWLNYWHLYQLPTLPGCSLLIANCM